MHCCSRPGKGMNRLSSTLTCVMQGVAHGYCMALAAPNCQGVPTTAKPDHWTGCHQSLSLAHRLSIGNHPKQYTSVHIEHIERERCPPTGSYHQYQHIDEKSGRFPSLLNICAFCHELQHSYKACGKMTRS